MIYNVEIKVDTAVEETCRACGHAPHWRECRGKTIGVISGDPIACECRHRGPSGRMTAPMIYNVALKITAIVLVRAPDLDAAESKADAIALRALEMAGFTVDSWETDAFESEPLESEEGVL